MNKPIAAGIVAQLGLIAATGAQAAETSYLRNSGDAAGKAGVAAPLGYCLRGIAVAGGVCAREQYLEEMADRERRRQPARRPAKERSDW